MKSIQQRQPEPTEIVMDYDIQQDVVVHTNNDATLLFGVPQRIDHAQDYLIRYGVVQPESAKDLLTVFRSLKKGAPHVETVVRARTVKGDAIWLQISMTTTFDAQGQPTHALGVLKDVTAQRDANLRWNDDGLHRQIMMREALIYYEANLTQRCMTFGAEALMRASELPPTMDYDTILGLLVATLVYPEDRTAVHAAFCAQSLLSGYSQGQSQVNLEYRRLTGEGTVIWVSGSAYLTKHLISHDVMLCVYVSSINERKLRELSLRDRAERDRLTGLYNKVTTELRVKESIAADQAVHAQGAILLLGLDDFQKINEQRGSYYGDALISQLGCQFSRSCRSEDLLGRSGGVEFLFYLRLVQDAQDALQRAQTLYNGAVQQLRGSGATLSAGLALSQGPDDNFERMRRHATVALSACRQAGGQISVYDPDQRSVGNKFSFISYPIDNGSFTENIAGHVFRTLYESQDLDATIQEVLEVVTEAFGFHRGYVFDFEEDGTALCAFEHFAHGIPPIHAAKHTLTQDQVVAISQLFGQNDTHLSCHNDDEVSEEARSALRLLFSFRSARKLCGFVGFSRLGMDNALSAQHQHSLQEVCRLLGVFLASRSMDRELRDSSLLLQSIVNGMNTCTYIIDPSTHIIKFLNQNAQETMPGALPGRCCYEVLRGRAAPCEDCPIGRMLREGTTVDYSVIYLEQFRVWARVSASLVTVPSGQIYGVFNTFDFSDQRHESGPDNALNDFTHDASLYDALSISTDDYIIMCDVATNRFYFPKKMVEEFNLPGQVILDAVPIWAQRIHKDDRADFLADLDIMFSGRSDTHDQEYRVQNRNGEWIWMRAKGHVERNKEGAPTLFAVVLSDLGRKSKVDHLTGLLDKYEFEVSTRAQLAAALPQGVLLLLGLDNFRYINNVYGWDFGDIVLKESSLRLLSTLPHTIQLYRLDSDKFGAFFPHASLSEVEEYYQSLFHIFRQHRQLGEHRYYCTVSAGCVYFQGEAPPFATLYKQASCALDISKRNGKNRITIYDAETMSGNERVLALMSALHDCVEQNCLGFQVYFQPQVDVKTQRIHSAEALLRWRHQDLGMVPPSEFVPLLEQTGLIHRVGRWVLLKAATVCHRWRETVPDFTISVNVSFAQLQDPTFLPHLTQQVETGALDPKTLHLEITESCIVDGSNQLGQTVQLLRQLGFLIEMDDFGTGYSSLEILKNAPADVVKIDQAFVRDIAHSKFDATFIQIIADLCHSVDIPVCLEGVETMDEYRLVEPMELDLIQGFLFGRPQPELDFAAHYIDGVTAIPPCLQEITS